MSPEELKAKSRRIFEAMNQRNLAVLDELWAPDMMVHANSMTIQGREAYKQSLLTLFTAFPDLQLTIEDQLAEGDMSVVRYTSQGTNQGDILGMPATGKRMQIPEISISRDVNGKTVEQWIIGDSLTMMQQLGVISTLGQVS
jgi:steroid delta-isomerase-like uncharacterized protein